MREEVFHGDWALKGLGFVQGAISCFKHAYFGKLWCPLRYRIIEVEFALFPQHESRDRRDRLCHRGNSKKRVTLHREIVLDVPSADHVELRDLALSPDQRHEA